MYYIYEEAKFFGNFFSKSFQQNEQKCLEGGFSFSFPKRMQKGTAGRALLVTFSPSLRSCEVRLRFGIARTSSALRSPCTNFLSPQRMGKCGTPCREGFIAMLRIAFP